MAADEQDEEEDYDAPEPSAEEQAWPQWQQPKPSTVVFCFTNGDLVEAKMTLDDALSMLRLYSRFIVTRNDGGKTIVLTPHVNYVNELVVTSQR